MGGSGGITTTSKEPKYGTTQTRLYDIDKFCLFRVTRGCEAKIIGPFAEWKVARSYSVVEQMRCKNVFGEVDIHMPIWHSLHFF